MGGADEWSLENLRIPARAVLSWTGGDLDVDGVTFVGGVVEAGRAEESEVLRDRAVPERKEISGLEMRQSVLIEFGTHLHR